MKFKKHTERKNSFWRALWSNRYLLFGILCLYWVFILISYVFKKEREPVSPVDVIFIFDTTGSMQEEIDKMVSISRNFATQLVLTGSKYRIGVVAFGGYNESSVIRSVCPMIEDVNKVRNFLSKFKAHGGGYEDQIYAMEFALNQIFRPKAKKIFILITDEDIGGSEEKGTRKITTSRYTLGELISLLKKQQITVYVVAIPAEKYKYLADSTGGKFYNIDGKRDFTDIVMSIGKEISVSLRR